MSLQPQVVVNADHRQKCRLFIAALRSYGRASLCVTGTSMLPALWPGDVVEVRTATIPEVNVNDIVAFSRDERIFVHRVLRQDLVAGVPVLITRGDALAYDDPAVNCAELLGLARVTERVPRTVLSWIRKAVQFRLLPPVLERLRS